MLQRLMRSKGSEVPCFCGAALVDLISGGFRCPILSYSPPCAELLNRWLKSHFVWGLLKIIKRAFGLLSFLYIPKIKRCWKSLYSISLSILDKNLNRWHPWQWHQNSYYYSRRSNENAFNQPGLRRIWQTSSRFNGKRWLYYSWMWWGRLFY